MRAPGVLISTGGCSICLPRVWHCRGQWSDMAKLYYIASGAAWVGVYGKRYPLASSRLYLIPPHAMLSYGATKETTIYWLHFHFDSTWFDYRLASLRRSYAFNANEVSRWTSTLRLIPACIRRPSERDSFLIHSMVLELSGIVFAHLPPESPGDRAAHERLLPSIEFMDTNASQHPSLSEIARTVHLSSGHFHRLFQAAYNTTPAQYLLGRRMIRAQQLLAEEAVPVKEAAQKCGFDDPFYFSRVFRQFFGVTPGAVRRGQAVIAPEP